MTQPLPASERKSNLLIEAGALLVAAAVATVMVLHLRGGSGPALNGPLPPPGAEVLAGLPPVTLQTDTAVFAGGCFWGVQAVFQHTRGVLQAVAGYAGGEAGQANYQMVSSGATRHAEVVSIRFDPQQISYAQLLHIFFSAAHDPTQLDRQHPDVGPQYRSAAFYKDAAQQQQLERYITQLDAAGVLPGKIVTQVSPFTAFYAAEAEHQNYFERNPAAPYIVAYDQPRLARFKAWLPDFYREQAVLVDAAGVADALAR
jgi:peptide-methionine (S)-S-oxide reductase